MINFKQYLAEETNRATDELSKSAVVRKAAKEMTLEDVVKDANPAIWTAREINGDKYLVYNRKYIDITELKKCALEVAI